MTTVDTASEIALEGPRLNERLALRVMQLGVIAAVVVAVTFRSFELDRFFVPKELALNVTAALAALLAWPALRRRGFERADRWLGYALALALVSTAFATNGWAALRAVAITAAAFLVFRVASSFRTSGLTEPLLSTLAFATTVAAAMSLLQTYGVELLWFSENRAPGGSLGNRNFVAHLAAIGWPLLMRAVIRAPRARSWPLAGLMISTAALVLTRSRGGWLAFALALAVTLIALVSAGVLRRDAWRRCGVALLASIVAVALALIVPNRLQWRSDDPYLDTVRHVGDYHAGSGHGRLIQYQHSLGLALRHPLLGVGPGNWAVEYPAHAAPRDPSLDDNERGMTSNPWPSSDWIASLAERGLAATLLTALALAALALGAWRRLRAATEQNEAIDSVALLALLVAAVVAGLFDAVLLLALPSLIVWSAAGSLRGETRGAAGMRGRPALVHLAAIVMALAGAAYDSADLMAMSAYESGSRAALIRASQIDRGNYRVQLRVARVARTRRERCDAARRAHRLFPHAAAARAAAAGCGD